MSLNVAIVGRPNVGKSTLFNRLAGRRHALVDDTPGVTRDRRELETVIGDVRCLLVDTAGFEETDGDRLEARMRAQTERAIAEADLCLFLIDARAGVTPLDEEFARLLRRRGRRVALIANKCEGRGGEAGAAEAFSLGLGDPIPVSAEHGEGLADIFELVHEAAAPEDYTEEVVHEGSDLPAGETIRLAIVGRPNVGKSTLANRLIGDERLLTGPEAGITRDAVEVPLEWNGYSVRLFDTAGLRRRAKITEKLEKLSAADAKRAIDFAEVVVLVIDALQPFEKQDLQIADMVLEEGRALVIAVNKWDLVDDTRQRMRELRSTLDESLAQIKGVPLVFLSALTGEGVDRLRPAIIDVRLRWGARIPTAVLNEWLADAVERHPPPAAKGRRIRLRYITQVKQRPPTFAVFTTRAGEVPRSYERYLINALRETFGLSGVPVRLYLRQRKNPYANSGRKSR